MNDLPNLPFDKLLLPLTSYEKGVLIELSQIPLKTFNETDVREHLLAPLIRLLGYRPGEYHQQVATEKKITLSPPFIMLGHKKYKLDYAFSVWKQGFWLLEAKEAQCESPNDPPTISQEDFGQAFAYSTHPQVDAPHFVISNGWVTNLYDRDSGSMEPILSIKQAELPQRFDELRKMLDATQITFHLKRKLLARIEKVLSADITLARAEDFASAMNKVVRNTRSKVIENYRAISSQQDAERRDAIVVALQSEPQLWRLIDTHLASCRSVGEMRLVATALAKRLVVEAPGSGNMYLFFSRLMLEEPRPVLIWYHLNALSVICAMVEMNPDFVISAPGFQGKTAKELYAGAVDRLLHHFKGNPPQRMMWAVEAAIGRITKRFLVCAAQRNMAHMAETMRYSIPEEALTLTYPSPAASVIACVEHAQQVSMGAVLADAYDFDRRQWKPELAKQCWSKLLVTERRLEEATPQYETLRNELGNQWSEVLFTDHVNKPWDRLGAGVCDVLHQYPTMLSFLSDQSRERITLMAGLDNTFAERCCQIMELEPVKVPDEEKRSILDAFFDPLS